MRVPAASKGRSNMGEVNREDRAMKKLHDDLAGTFRRFGDYGPVYEILSPLRKANAKGGKMYKIRVPETGEVAEIDAEAILADPVAN
jgi:hypothetical protein